MKKSKEFLTKIAAKEISRIMEEQGYDKKEKFIRLGMKGGGCAGFTYVLDFSYTRDEFDLEYMDKYKKITIDKKSDFFMESITVDFHNGLLDRGFKFLNPDAISTCGCGTAFSM